MDQGRQFSPILPQGFFCDIEGNSTDATDIKNIEIVAEIL